ncbi:MAG TPA: hypothetical protein DGT23_16085 [Micromonosporaceae bacterium]|nr:hypothetical protein [Micromonosporaceae bacterium]
MPAVKGPPHAPPWRQTPERTGSVDLAQSPDARDTRCRHRRGIRHAHPARGLHRRGDAHAAPDTASPMCLSPGVTLTAGQVDAAMGLQAMRVEMMNCGSQPYTANGDPALQVLDADRKPLDVTVFQGTARISSITGRRSRRRLPPAPARGGRGVAEHCHRHHPCPRPRAPQSASPPANFNTSARAPPNLAIRLRQSS